MDHLTAEKRSGNMSRIRGKNTKPEIAVRKVLSKMGIKYRLHSRKLPGKPDVVISKTKTAIFINGCFWHQHKDCKRKSMPKTNAEYWKPKLSGNVVKQEKEIQEIRKLGWKTFIVWECQTTDRKTLSEKLGRILI